jgi:hypothetical protein
VKPTLEVVDKMLDSFGGDYRAVILMTILTIDRKNEQIESLNKLVKRMKNQNLAFLKGLMEYG